MNTRASGSSSNLTTSKSGTAIGKRKATGGEKSGSRTKSTGKKGNDTSSGVHDFEITEENMAIFKAMQAKLKAQKKAAAASQDEGKFI
jgi:hypothetical protein